jgi:hypothetical protein
MLAGNLICSIEKEAGERRGEEGGAPLSPLPYVSL